MYNKPLRCRKMIFYPPVWYCPDIISRSLSILQNNIRQFSPKQQKDAFCVTRKHPFFLQAVIVILFFTVQAVHNIRPNNQNEGPLYNSFILICYELAPLTMIADKTVFYHFGG